MLDKIFHFLFDKDKELSNKTIIKKREISTERSYNLLKKDEQKDVETCLSKYFVKRVGLNLKERNKVC